jgi:hypothetical protein
MGKTNGNVPIDPDVIQDAKGRRKKIEEKKMRRKKI